MPRIYVEFSGLDQIGSRCKTVASRVDTIQSDFQRTVRQLDWDIRFESNINSTATQIARKLDQYSRALEAYQRFIEDAYNEYVKLDEYKKLTLADYIAPISFDPNSFIIVGPGGQLNFDWSKLIKDVFIKKPYVLPTLLNLVSPVTSLLYITSGIPFGNTPSVFDYSRTPSASRTADWLGYEFSEDNPGVTAWVGKASAEAQNEWGYAGVNAYLGKGEAEAKADAGIMKTTKRKCLSVCCPLGLI